MAEQIAFAKYTAEQLRALASKGQAMPDGSYPCADAEDVGKAIQAVGRGNAGHDAIRKMIMRNAKRLGVKVPDNWNPDGSLKAAAQLGIIRQSTRDAAAGAYQTFTIEPIVQTPTERAEAIPPTREEREQAAAAVRAMQAALAPQVEALYETDAGMDVFEAFDHFGRAADALHYAFPGATGIALAELTAAAELLRQAAGRSTEIAIRLNPIATDTETALGNVATWPVTHAGAKDKAAFAENARLVLSQPEPGSFVLTDGGVEVARFAAEGDALEAVAGYALPEDDPAQGTPFNIFLAPEGVESGDGRLLELGTVTWRDPPMALMMQDTTAHGPGEPAPAWFAGAIERAWRDPAEASRIMGRGHLVPGPDGVRAEAQIRAGMRGVSIDGLDRTPPNVQVTQVGADGEPIKALVRYSDTKILGATVLPFGAFEATTIWFDDEPTPQRVTMTHGQTIPTDAAPAVVDSEPLAALVASSGGPLKPPKAWFHVEHPNEYMPLTVTSEGQVMGHIGPAGSCHIGQVGRCTTIPTSSTNYRYFHRTIADTAEGEKVACGWLTMNTSHERNLRVSAQAAMDHYDHTGTQVAKIRVVDTPHGPFACGAIAPGLSDEQIWKLQGPEVSGDWRPIDGYMREMVAVLAVPLPGFLTQRPEALVASGQIVAQIGTLPCDDCEPSMVEDFPTVIRVSASDMAMLRALRPQAMAAIREKVAPVEMVEAARKAQEPTAAQEWRDRLRV